MVQATPLEPTAAVLRARVWQFEHASGSLREPPWRLQVHVAGVAGGLAITWRGCTGWSAQELEVGTLTPSASRKLGCPGGLNASMM